jgi:hypothetical protein
MSDESRYLYCIARSREDLQLGGIGIEEKLVYTVHHRGIAAIVHSCSPAPYDTKDNALAEGWVLEHSYVIDHAMKKFGTVLPFSFDVIIRGDDEVIRGWLDRNYERLQKDLERLADRAEYSVQIFYDYDRYASEELSSNCDLLSLKEKIDAQSRGKAYLLQRNLDLKLKDAVSSYVKKMAEKFGLEIVSIADEVQAEERHSSVPEKYKDMKLMAAFSCLVYRDKVDLLGLALEKINCLDGLAVRFTGPWAPFSFVDTGGA